MNFGRIARYMALLLACAMALGLFSYAFAEGWDPDTPEPTVQPTATPEVTATPEATDTPDVTATPESTPAASPTNTPAANSTPTATLTSTPAATPTATPAYSVKWTGDAVTVALGMEYDLREGVSAKDENGNALTVAVADSGGFDAYVPGEYRITYSATHPETGKAFTYTRTIWVGKTAAQQKYTLTMVLSELVYKQGASKYDLDNNAYALDENGDKVSVSRISNGGFNISVAGTYSVLFIARHPVTGERVQGTRTVRVLCETDYKAWQKQQNRLSGDSNERYAKYRTYRNEIAAELAVQMEDLTQQMQQRILALCGALGAHDYTLVRAIPTLLDDSQDETETTGTGEEAFLYELPTDDASFEALDALAIDNWSDILAVFVAENSLEVDEPLDLINLRKITFDGLAQVFFEMNPITYHMDDETGNLRIMICPRTAREYSEICGWSQDHVDVLEELLQPEFLSVFASLTGDTTFSDMSEADAEEIRGALPEGLNVQRESIVVTAYSLVNKVSYFWGGKYNEVGWNPLWGIPTRVTSEGSKTTGKVRNYGLDCSGYVAWVFINALGDTAVLDAIGSGSADQWSNSLSLGWEEAQPGDLAFKAKPGSVDINHVGIVVSKEADGTYMIAHCSSSLGGVVVSEAWESGFRYLRRPALYGED